MIVQCMIHEVNIYLAHTYVYNLPGTIYIPGNIIIIITISTRPPMLVWAGHHHGHTTHTTTPLRRPCQALSARDCPSQVARKIGSEGTQQIDRWVDRRNKTGRMHVFTTTLFIVKICAQFWQYGIYLLVSEPVSQTVRHFCLRISTRTILR